MRESQPEGQSSRKPELKPGEPHGAVRGVFIHHWLSLSTGHPMGCKPPPTSRFPPTSEWKNRFPFLGAGRERSEVLGAVVAGGQVLAEVTRWAKRMNAGQEVPHSSS